VIIGGILLIGTVGFFVEVILAALLLSAAAWAVVAVLALVALIVYLQRLSGAVRRGDWAFVTDLLLVPLLAGGLALALSISAVNFLGMTAKSSPPVPIIILVIFSVWVAPFLGVYWLLSAQRWQRLCAYPLCFLATYTWMYLVINWKAVSAR